MRGNSVAADVRRRTLALTVVLLVMSGCAKHDATLAQARELFERTVTLYHLPSAQADGAKRAELLARAAAGYEQLLRDCPGQTHWCAQALRSLGNVRAAQGRTSEALLLYERVARNYPREDWEVLQAWKAAADFLFDAGQLRDAAAVYRRIIDRFAITDAPPVVELVVHAAKRRIANVDVARHGL